MRINILAKFLHDLCHNKSTSDNSHETLKRLPGIRPADGLNIREVVSEWNRTVLKAAYDYIFLLEVRESLIFLLLNNWTRQEWFLV